MTPPGHRATGTLAIVASRSPSNKPTQNGASDKRSFGDVVADTTRSRSRELIALVLIALAIISGLALFGDRAGAVGDVLQNALAVAVGVFRYVVPVVLLWAALELILGRSSERGLRAAFGLAQLSLACTGMAHLASDADGFGPDLDALREGGGLTGAVLAAPLVALVERTATWAILALLVLFSIIVILNVSLRQVLHGVGRATTKVFGSLRLGYKAAAGSLQSIGKEDPDAETPGAEAADTSDLANATVEHLTPAKDPHFGEFIGESPGAADEPGVANRSDAEGHGEAGPGGTAQDQARESSSEPEEDKSLGAGESLDGDEVAPVEETVEGATADGTTSAPASMVPGLSTPSSKKSQASKKTQASTIKPDKFKSPQWELPNLALLERTTQATAETERQKRESSAQLQAGAELLEAALASHGVEAQVIGTEEGPTVTRYELTLGSGVKVARITSLHRDIAYAMAATDVRILAPIPGRSAIGVEVPNARRRLVSLGDILVSGNAKKAKHPLQVALGRDISGSEVMTNLATMPHLLIAGATGSGKSSCINSLITSLLMRTTPDEVRMILVDPKRVELGQYDRLPHLLTGVVTNPKKAANALAWVVSEMERRYDVLSSAGFRDITGYNEAFDAGLLAASSQTDGTDDPDSTASTDSTAESDAESGAATTAAATPAEIVAEVRAEFTDEPEHERMPFIVVVVDELNDLMMVAARDVEDTITRLAQMARAVGIHLVIATQRPSVNVITGVIKANIPSRMAFAVSSQADSRVILDQPGAERLVGRGDMLLVEANNNVLRRVQGCWVSEAEVHRVVAHWLRQAPENSYVTGVDQHESSSASAASMRQASSGDNSDEDLMKQAMIIVVESQLGSTSMLQRKLKVGFARAGRLMDLLEQRGVVGPSQGSKARDVLMTKEELSNLNAGDQQN